MKEIKIFIRLAECFQEEISQYLIAPLREKGCTITERFMEHPLEEQQLIDALQGYTIAVIGTEDISRRVLEQTKLSMVCCSGGGLNHVDLKAAEALGIMVTHAPLANIHAVAEFAAAVLLDRMRRVTECRRAVENGSWPLLVGKYSGRTTVGIIGLGNIGRLAARKISGIGFHVIGYDVIRGEDSPYFEFVDMQQLLERSNAILIHIPLTAQTRGMIGEKEIAAMRNRPCIINLSRGGIVDERALVKALQEKRISGAALDVFEHEPLAESDLLCSFGEETLLLTPHVAATTRDAVACVSETISKQITSYLEGAEPPFTVVGAAAER